MKKTVSAIMAVIIVITTIFSVGMISTSATTLKAPVITKTEAVANGVKLTWATVPGAARYRVFVKSGNRWKTLGDTYGTTWTDKKAAYGKNYTYTVRCVTKSGDRFTSRYDYNGTSAKYLSTPSGLTVRSIESGHRIAWNRVAGADKYRIFMKKNNKWVVIANTTQAVYINKVHGTATYTVRCLSKDGKAFTSYYKTSGSTIYEVKMPYYDQLNYGDVPFGSVKGATLKSHGSAQVAFAMVVSSLNTSNISPKDVVKWKETAKYCVNEGTKWGYFKDAARHYGFVCQNDSALLSEAITALKQGKPVICLQAPGLFTSGGHFIVLRGITSTGKILVSDPNGGNANKWGLSTNQYLYKEWTYDQIKASASNNWIFSK